MDAGGYDQERSFDTIAAAINFLLEGQDVGEAVLEQLETVQKWLLSSKYKYVAGEPTRYRVHGIRVFQVMAPIHLITGLK